jgi:antitoxin component YwqK of YwqJK toxin-antitoxin module
MFDGLTTVWHDNGQKELEINFKDGKVDGLSTWWYDIGQKKYEVNYKDGKEVN